MIQCDTISEKMDVVDDDRSVGDSISVLFKLLAPSIFHSSRASYALAKLKPLVPRAPTFNLPALDPPLHITAIAPETHLSVTYAHRITVKSRPTERPNMATFMDLPKDVRERIYRLHLVRDKPITNSEHHKIVKHRKKFTWGWRATPEKAMPPLLSVSSKIEKEAAPIYYGENHFDLGDIGPLHQDCKILTITWRRHLKFVRKITCTWAKFLDNWGGYGMIGENWKRLSKLKGLEELNIRVDEADLLKFMAVGREVRQRGVHVMSPTPQQQLAILRFPGIAGLLSIQQVKNVKFIERVDENGKKYGGPIAGGALETHILPRLNTSAIKPNKRL